MKKLGLLFCIVGLHKWIDNGYYKAQNCERCTFGHRERSSDRRTNWANYWPRCQ